MWKWLVLNMMHDSGYMMQAERTAQRAVPTTLPTTIFPFPIFFHIKELREL
jgi:hypothetical protein